MSHFVFDIYLHSNNRMLLEGRGVSNCVSYIQVKMTYKLLNKRLLKKNNVMSYY